MRIVLFSLLLFFATAQVGLAQHKIPPSWQTVRDHQPAGVHLLLALPRTHYYMGEVITATLTFSHDAKDVYFLSGPSGGRSGRVNDVAFRGEGNDHWPIRDPLEWYLQNHLLMGGGGGTQKYLGPLEFSLAANQWLQFEKPGTYQIYAWSSCLVPGVRGSVLDQRPPPVELVSDPVTITIEPLPAEVEKKIIEEATQVLNKQREVGRFDLAFDALERLRFLQTPAADDALLQFVDVGGSEASLSFYGRSNYAASAAHILTLVQEGRLGLSENLLFLYSGLKSGGFLDFVSGGDAMQPDRLAREELFAAAGRVMENGTGNEAFFADLIESYRRNPQDPAIRSRLIQRQLELPRKQIDALFGERSSRMDGKPLLAEKDFLPLIRELSKPERHNPVALEALAKLAPEEAKPIILEDIRLSRPVYIPPPKTFYPNRDFLAFAALPDRELSELDPILRAKLPLPPYDDEGEDLLEATMLLIDRYATKALLPDVLRIYETREGHWPCVFQSAVLRYWIRCDATAGLEGLRQALGRNAPDQTGCFRFVLTDVLRKAWVDEALPLVLTATTHEDPDVVRDATTLLAAHAGPEAVEPIIVAIERIAAGLLREKTSARHEPSSYIPGSLTISLLDHEGWTLTRPQIERLLKVATDPMLQTRLKSLLAGPEK